MLMECPVYLPSWMRRVSSVVGYVEGYVGGSRLHVGVVLQYVRCMVACHCRHAMLCLLRIT